MYRKNLFSGRTHWNGRRLRIENLEERTLLSTVPPVEDVTLSSETLQSIINTAPAIPTAFAAKVNGYYWQIAESVSQATQDGSLTGGALQTALASLSLPAPNLAPINATGALYTVISTVDTSPNTISAIESLGINVDDSTTAQSGVAWNANRVYAWVPAHLVDSLTGISTVVGVTFPDNAGISAHGADGHGQRRDAGRRSPAGQRCPQPIECNWEWR